MGRSSDFLEEDLVVSHPKGLHLEDPVVDLEGLEDPVAGQVDRADLGAPAECSRLHLQHLHPEDREQSCMPLTPAPCMAVYTVIPGSVLSMEGRSGFIQPTLEEHL
ncbi:hypothetical protein [Halobacillus kuroshimensis]|uniref:hypothetical protein n=1 Tax=Halobacillus kuroshimensis TaxID=302481 RepID=UPI001A8D255A|nr:hypothetical protein [Halobacillus kuroshimensis]